MRGADGVDPIDPDATLYSTVGDPDLVIPDDYAELTAFDSGSVIDGFYADDTTFSPVLSVFSGTGYGSNIGQIGYIGFPAGFAGAYETLDFKVKGLPNQVIFVKLFDNVDALRINLTSSTYSGSLGDGWFQVSIPLSSFAGVDQATGIVFESDNTAALQFTFFLTDIGFSGTGTGGPQPADPGIIPDVTLYDRDGDPDLVFGVDYADILTFGSGAALDGNDVSDVDFSPAFSVTTGFGYDKWNAQLAYVGFAAGFATDYESLDFKAKGLSGDLIRVKFLDGGAYIDINLTSSGYSTALGNDWYQVSVPIADFSGVDTALGLLFETIEPAPAESFTYLLTDIGFSGTAGGGGGTNLGVFSETNIETVVNITNIVSGGNPVTIDTASTAVTPFEGAVSLQLVYSDNAANNNYGGAIFEFGDEDLSAYDTLKFSIDTSAFTNFANLTVQLEPPGGGTPGGNVGLAGYTPVATAGNWNTYEIPLTDFTALNPSLVNKLGFFNARDAGDVLLAGTLYLDDIHFTTVGGGGPGGPVGDGTFVNGDFEAGDFTGWTQTPDGGSITLDSSEQGGRAGTVARLVATGAASGAQDVLLSQVDLVEINSVSLSGGDSVTVSVDVFGSLTGAGGVVFIELISRAANGSETGRNFIGPAPITPTAMWTTQSSTVNVAADVSGGITLQLKSSCGAVDGCGVDASFDNVSMVIN